MVGHKTHNPSQKRQQESSSQVRNGTKEESTCTCTPSNKAREKEGKNLQFPSIKMNDVVTKELLSDQDTVPLFLSFKIEKRYGRVHMHIEQRMVRCLEEKSGVAEMDLTLLFCMALFGSTHKS